MPAQLADLPWLTILIALPAVAAALIWLVPVLRKIARPLGLAVSLLVLIGAAVMAAGFDTGAGGYQFTETYTWISQLGVSWAVGLNGMGLVLVLLAVVLVPIVMLASWNEVQLPEGIKAEAAEKALAYRRAGYVALLLLLLAMMIGVFAARDLFLFYILFEAMLVPIYFMIGAYGGAGRRAAAVKFLLYGLAGGLVMLAGVVLVAVRSGGGEGALLLDNLADVAAGDSPAVGMWLFLTFFIAFAIKAPMVPVHTWLPDSAGQAPPGTSALLVGVLDKVGTFGMIAICLPLFPAASAAAAPAIIVLAIISIIYGGILAIGQHDLMRMIAFSSVSHFGFIVMGVFVGTQTAMVGAMLYMVAHGVTIAALFLISGFLTQRGGSQDMRTYSGMQRVTRVIAGTWLFAGLASLALPGLSGFVPEYLVFLGSFEAHWAYGVFAVIGVVLSALYILLAYKRVFTGPVEPARAELTDAGGRERWTIVPLAVGILFLGFFPAPVLDLLTGTADQFVAILGSAS
ncbi:MAG TPA: NADH-quinone oxidoreductase subunit M [Candidatus Ruania gallistercoris]|uniref:NADH-quinone oxidoreductase subunit M n=1 Tax=Candidatus Ruania gallistercoris TaxID=2838746 RepID=A0A9D2J606_9MICO|nr:NADH-quinone oxidoreductase subunit M [Candidatus Ruania gallistercoris]